VSSPRRPLSGSSALCVCLAIAGTFKVAASSQKSSYNGRIVVVAALGRQVHRVRDDRHGYRQLDYHWTSRDRAVYWTVSGASRQWADRRRMGHEVSGIVGCIADDGTSGRARNKTRDY